MAPRTMQQKVFSRLTSPAHVLAVCREFQFSEEITHEMLWDTAYLLGRARWYWGPSWRWDLQNWLKGLFKWTE